MKNSFAAWGGDGASSKKQITRARCWGSGTGSMFMDVIWTESPLIDAFKDYRISIDRTSQHTKCYRAELPTPETQLETDSHKTSARILTCTLPLFSHPMQ